MASDDAIAPATHYTVTASSDDFISSQVAGMSLQESSQTLISDGSALGTSPVMVMFRQGGVVVLQSVASGSALCIYEGQVSGKGIRDSYSQFKVHIWPSGRISLQNVAHPDCWLTIFEGKTLGTGSGGPYSEFNLREIEEKYVALESAFYPDQHVGIREDGELQVPEKTPPLDRAALFIPFFHSSPTPTASYTSTAVPEKEELPPPYPGPSPSMSQSDAARGPVTGTRLIHVPPSLTPNSFAPPPLTPYEPPAYPTLDIQPPSSYPRQPAPYPQPRASPVMSSAAMRNPLPTEPTIPLGYETMDLFSKFNLMVIIPRTDLSYRPIRVVYSTWAGHPSLKTGGTYLSADSEIDADYSSNGGLMLRHHASRAAFAATTSMKIRLTEKPSLCGIGCEFVVRRVEGMYVVFESVKFPHHYISVGPSGVVKLEQHSQESHEVQFTIRINGFKGIYSQNLMSPFSVGRPSIVNSLKDRLVIQLYHKPTMMYLCLVEGGKVVATQSEEEGTFLVYRDRGLGRVSLTGYYRGILKLRMEYRGKLSSIGVEDIFMDFYIKEALNGCIKFESVAYPGQFVHLQSRGGAFSDFSVYLLVPKSCYTILCCYSLPDYHTCMQSVSSSRIVRRLCTCCHVDTGYEQGHRKGPQKNHPKICFELKKLAILQLTTYSACCFCHTNGLILLPRTQCSC